MSRALIQSPPKSHKSRPIALLEYLVLRLLLTLLHILPLALAYRLSEAILVAIHKAFPSIRRKTIEHIEIAFSDSLSPEEKRHLLHQSIRYNAWSWLEALIAPHLLRKAKYQNRIDASEALAALQEREADAKNGILLVSAHLGTPDLISLRLSQLGYPLAVVARPLDNPHIAKLVARKRRDYQRTELAKTGALRPAYRCLKDKGIVGLQIDQDAGETGIFVPFFGKLASTHGGAATLALTSKAPIFMIFCVREQPRAFKFKLHVSEVESSVNEPDGEDAAKALTARMTLEIEAMIRRFPEQYLWAHRRWKTRPR